MPSLNTRSTGNRRAVRNALFRSMMDGAARRRKLHEADLLNRFDRTIPAYFHLTASPCVTKGPPPAAAHEIIYVPPEPPSWLRLVRRLVYGEK